MEAYLDRCLSSLIIDNDWMPLFEVLVINDGSKDRTSELAHSYETRFPDTIRVIDKQNGHYGSCVNRGLQEAHGAFVKILDADDTFNSTVFESFLVFLQERVENADLILSEYIQVDDKLNLIDEHLYDDYAEPFMPGELSAADRVRWFIHGLTYRTSLLREIGYRQTEGVAYTDLEWCFYPAAFVRRAYRFHGFLYRYTKMREEQSVAPSIHGKNIEMQIGVVENLVKNSSRVIETCLVENRLFLQELLELNVSHIYQLVLLTLHRHIPSDTALLSFDQMLLEVNPSLYEQIGQYSTGIGPFRFTPIKLWREGGKTRLRFIQWLYSTADFISRMRRTIVL